MEVSAKENGKRPANPATPRDHTIGTIGLTKRELFAAMAMQGLLASFSEKAAIGAWCTDIKDVAEVSVEFSDALLLALETEPANGQG